MLSVLHSVVDLLEIDVAKHPIANSNLYIFSSVEWNNV